MLQPIACQVQTVLSTSQLCQESQQLIHTSQFNQSYESQWKIRKFKKKKHKRISLSPAAFDCFWVFLIALFVFYLRQKRSRKSFRCCRLLSADFLLLPTHIFLFDMLMSLNGHVFLKPFYCLVPAWLPRQKSCDRILLISPSFFLFQTLTYKYTYTSSDIAVWF